MQSATFADAISDEDNVQQPSKPKLLMPTVQVIDHNKKEIIEYYDI